ncbi:MAG TPA: class I SAM-dependent methyltransferase [Candidatus Ozemobacteraceae bacterium]
MRGMPLKNLQAMFAAGVNIIEHLRSQGVESQRAVEISYDLQAGTYIRDMTGVYAEYIDKYSSELAGLINGLGVPFESLLEAGVGEATTLANVVKRLEHRPAAVRGFDVSWSRVKYAKKYYRQVVGDDAGLFLGDLFQMPYADDSIDIVYTSHSIEPNGGREAEALTELCRVARKYLILFEPSYELATPEGKAHIERHGYVKGLPETARRLGLRIVESRAARVSARPSNPTGILVIAKHPEMASNPAPELVCPIGKGRLEQVSGGYWADSSLYLYPELDGIPCLCPGQGVIATHYRDFHRD